MTHFKEPKIRSRLRTNRPNYPRLMGIGLVLAATTACSRTTEQAPKDSAGSTGTGDTNVNTGGVSGTVGDPNVAGVAAEPFQESAPEGGGTD